MNTPTLKDIARIDRVMNAVAAGTSVQNSSSVDMQADTGYDEVTFMAAFGTLTAGQVTNIKLQESDDNATWATAPTGGDSVGTLSSNLADANSNTMLLSTVRPMKRYVRCVVTRGTQNAVIDGVWAFLQKSTKAPVSQAAAVIQWKTNDSKGIGTA